MNKKDFLAKKLGNILKKWDICPAWTLFLDRDGVINQKKEGGYIQHWEEFTFGEGVLDSLPILNQYFQYILVVTNQQGIGKGLMSENDLATIVQQMKVAIKKTGGQINAFYHCPHLAADPTCRCRKPKTGMAWQAKRDFPNINFEQSIMVGDSVSDLEFGRALGMKTVMVLNGRSALAFSQHPAIDLCVGNLAIFTSLVNGS